MRVLPVLLLVASVRLAAAQTPDQPLQAGTGARVTVAGELTATYGSDDPGFFNYATYAYEPLQNVRMLLDASLRASSHLEVLAQVRTDGTSDARLSAAYVRLRPWTTRAIDVQAGRIPTTFGLFGRSGYGADNPVIGRPLAYTYLTSLRRDALPVAADDVIRMRGRGWLSSFPAGNLAPDRGLPIADNDSWDTGVQLRAARGAVEWAGAVTQGALGSPRVHDDNGSLAWSTRLTVRATPGLTFGASGARGAFLSRSLTDDHRLAVDVTRHTQNVAGLDAHYAAGRWQVRGEILRSTWSLPLAAGAAALPLRAVASWAETRVRVVPGLDLAARGDYLTFSDIAGPVGPTPWEAAVSRVETGVTATPMRHLRLKLAVQRNRRPLGGRVRHDTLVAAQLGVWF